MSKIALHWQIMVAMIIGAVLGIFLNMNQGELKTEITDADNLPAGVTKLTIEDSPNRIVIDIEHEDADKSREVVVDGSGKDGAYPTLKKLGGKDAEALSLFRKHGRANARIAGDWGQTIGGLFLRMLKMVAVPLIIASLASGVMGLGDASRLSRMFGRTLTYYIATSLLAIVTGIIMVNVIRPGINSSITAAAAEAPTTAAKSLSDVLFQQLEKLIPTNPFTAVTNGDFLSIISFTLMFSITTVVIGGKQSETLKGFANACFDVMMKLTMVIIKLAPIGVFGLMLSVTATQGAQVFKSLAWYMLTVILALGVHAIITLPLLLWFVAKRSPLQFVRSMSPALMTAFSSASSNGTLPVTMASVEKRAGVSNKTSSFVLPLGATINMDGTALYEAVAVLFIAQIYHGGDLPLAQQIIVAFTALLASIGAAGIPHAGLVMMVIILQAVGLPLEYQGIILAVDRVLDMCRTMVNVWSDSCGCAVIDRFESPPGG